MPAPRFSWAILVLRCAAQAIGPTEPGGSWSQTPCEGVTCPGRGLLSGLVDGEGVNDDKDLVHHAHAVGVPDCSCRALGPPSAFGGSAEAGADLPGDAGHGDSIPDLLLEDLGRIEYPIDEANPS